MSVFATIGVEILTAHAAIHQVVDGAGKLNAGRAKHRIKLRARGNPPKPRLTLDAEQSLVRHTLGSDPKV